MARLTKVSLILESFAETKGIKAFNQEMNRLSAAQKKLGPALEVTKKIMGGVAAAGGVVAGAVAAAAKAALSYAADTRAMADQVGVSAEKLQVLAHVARFNGANVKDFNMALMQTAKVAGEAANGNEAAAKKFALLGIDARKFIQLAPEKQLERMGRAIAAAENQQAALSAAMQIVGAEKAPRLLQALKQLGSEGFEALEESARKAGVVMSESMVTQLDIANARIDQFKARLTIAGGEIVQTFLDIEKGFGGLSGAAKALSEAEAESGVNSRAAAKARLEYIDALIKEGKIKQAQIEMERAPQSFGRIDGRAAGKANAEATAYAKRRAEMLAAIEAELARQTTRTAEQAAKAKADAAEAASVAIIASAEKAAKAEQALARANAKARQAYADEVRQRDMERTQQAMDKAEEAAREHKSRLDAILGRSDDFTRRGLQLGAARPDLFGMRPSERARPDNSWLNSVGPAARIIIEKSDNAGREDAKQTSILGDIKNILDGISRKETALA